MAEVTLTGFLLARIAEDEAEANTYMLLPGATTGGHFWGEHGRWFPARVLAECEAKRQIVEQYRIMRRGADWSDGIVETLELNIHALALPYSDHPDYLPEWKS